MSPNLDRQSGWSLTSRLSGVWDTSKLVCHNICAHKTSRTRRTVIVELHCRNYGLCRSNLRYPTSMGHRAFQKPANNFCLPVNHRCIAGSQLGECTFCCDCSSCNVCIRPIWARCLDSATRRYGTWSDISREGQRKDICCCHRLCICCESHSQQ